MAMSIDCKGQMCEHAEFEVLWPGGELVQYVKHKSWHSGLPNSKEGVVGGLNAITHHYSYCTRLLLLLTLLILCINTQITYHYSYYSSLLILHITLILQILWIVTQVLPLLINPYITLDWVGDLKGWFISKTVHSCNRGMILLHINAKMIHYYSFYAYYASLLV